MFGNSKPLLAIDTDSYVIIPNMVTFADLDSTIDYNQTDGTHIAEIEYAYHDMYVGKAYLNLSADNASSYEFDSEMTAADISVEKVEPAAEEPDTQGTIFINIKKVLIVILILAATVITFLMIYALITNNRAARRRENRVKRKKKRRSALHMDFEDFDF